MKSFLPPANKYISHKDWQKDLQHYSSGGSPLKGKFLKGERITLSAEIIKASKKIANPGPGAYESLGKDKLIGLFKVKEEKSQFIDEAKFVGHQTPGAIYNPNFNYIKPKILTTKVYADKRKKSTGDKIKKSNDPCVGLYEVEKAYVKTQLSQRIPQFSKKVHKNFMDIYKKSKEWLPGVGSY